MIIKFKQTIHFVGQDIMCGRVDVVYRTYKMYEFGLHETRIWNF